MDFSFAVVKIPIAIPWNQCFSDIRCCPGLWYHFAKLKKLHDGLSGVTRDETCSVSDLRKMPGKLLAIVSIFPRLCNPCGCKSKPSRDSWNCGIQNCFTFWTCFGEDEVHSSSLNRYFRLKWTYPQVQLGTVVLHWWVVLTTHAEHRSSDASWQDNYQSGTRRILSGKLIWQLNFSFAI